MNIHVYDTYAQGNNGKLLHFDIFLPKNNSLTALKIARQWLTEIGEDGDKLTQERCRFCHTESANANVAEAIEKDGYYILQMEGCPNPV
ncbi:MAG: DUF2024 family protein [Mariprofundaceae bacterium]